MTRRTARCLASGSLALALGCSNGDGATEPHTPPAARVAAAPAPPPAAEPRKPDLAARCDAVDYDGPRENDHLPKGLRAIANELIARGPSALQEIEESLPLSVNLRRTAPDVLYKWPSDRTRALLVRQLDDPDDQAAHHAAWALGNIGGPEVVEPLLAAASKPKSSVIDQVLSAMPNLPKGTADRAFDLIASSLASKDRWTRGPAAGAMACVTNPENVAKGIDLLTKAMETETDPRAKSSMESAVAQLRTKM